MWALQRLRKLLTTEYGQSININRLLGDSDGEARSMVSTWSSNVCHPNQIMFCCHDCCLHSLTSADSDSDHSVAIDILRKNILLI